MEIGDNHTENMLIYFNLFIFCIISSYLMSPRILFFVNISSTQVLVWQLDFCSSHNGIPFSFDPT